MNYRHLLLSFALILLYQTLSAQSPGHNYTYNTRNLSAEEIYLSLDGEPYLGKEFPVGSSARLVFDGVRGYQALQGKVFPRMRMQVVEKKPGGRVVLQYDNLLKEYEVTGMSPATASVLSTNLTIGKPLQSGKAYEWRIEITEATGKGRIHLTYDFQVVGEQPEETVAESERFLYEPVELGLEDVILEIDGQRLASLDLPDQANVDMVFRNVEGLSVKNGLIYPGMAVRVTDASGQLVLEAADLFADYNGLSAERAQRLVANLTIGHPMQVNKTYVWEAYIWDKNWPRRSVYARLAFRVIPTQSEGLGQK